jgi:GNAT superfamily N-acetyltransferase
VIRPATEADARALAEIQARGWRHAYADIVDPERMPDPDESEPRWRAFVADPATDAIVLEQERIVAGFASFGASRDAGTDARTGELYAIYVEPGAQGAGVGTVLLEAAVGGLRERGFADAMLWTLQGNGLARAFYERHGWAVDEGAVQHEPPEVRYRRTL